jgi:hypothetical protein
MHFRLWVEGSKGRRVEGSLFSGGVDPRSRKWKLEKRMKRMDVGGGPGEELKRPHGMPEAGKAAGRVW